MITVDFENLLKSLSEIPAEDEFDPDDGKELKKLFLVLAGDQRVISKISLEEMAGMFEDASRLLERYTENLNYRFSESAMVDYADAVRRAV